MAHDIFISYSSHDKPIADAVCATLENQNMRCWIAPRDIIAGVDWSDAIIDAITECRLFVLILSSASNLSEQVKREVQNAVSEGKPILPFRIEEVDLSKHMRYFIGTPHWLDALTPPMEHHLQRMVQTVGALLSAIDEKGLDHPNAAQINLKNKAEINDQQDEIWTQSAQPRITVSEIEMDVVCKQLAEYIGPLAKVLVKKSARDASTIEDLYHRLSEHLTNPKEKNEFLSKLGQR